MRCSVEAGRAGVSRRSNASLGRHIGRTTRQIHHNTKQLREDFEAIRKTRASDRVKLNGREKSASITPALLFLSGFPWTYKSGASILSIVFLSIGATTALPNSHGL